MGERFISTAIFHFWQSLRVPDQEQGQGIRSGELEGIQIAQGIQVF